jgi:excisionase family DNA binding protein
VHASVDYVYRLIRAGKLPVSRISAKHYLIRRSDLDALVEAKMTGTAA